MPISHWGISVTHIPSATSFYLAALQPLGYRFIGHQGDSIGLGVDSADFFITQAPLGTRPSPNHIAFLAESRLIVRECYAAALNSGAYPSGSPKYRNEECECFNAAVEDLDGNTIEFIFRQPHGNGNCCGTVKPAEDQRVITWQKDVEEGAPEDAQSVAESQASRGTMAFQASKAKSRIQTLTDLVSNTSKSVKSDTPSQGISRTNTASVKPDFPAKGLIGVALGAAAGAGLMYAMHRAESRNAQEESDHLAYMSSKNSRRQSVAGTMRPPPPPKAETVKESIPPPPPPPSSKHDTRKFHRNFSTTESAYSRRPPPPETRAMRMIADTGYNKDDEDVQEVLSRYTSMRPHATRNRDDEVECAPASRAPKSEAPSGHSIKRASTLPVGALEDRPNYYLEAPPAKSSGSRYASRHGSVSGSQYDRRSSHDDANLTRHDSGVSMHSSHRSHRDRDRNSEGGRRSSASTIKPSRRDSKYDDVQAAVEAAVGKRASSKAPDSCYYPAAISLPPSKVESRTDRERDRSHAGSKAPTYISTRDAQIPPLEAVESKQSWEDFPGDESDGLGDVRTVMPDDSISCVDLSKRRRKHHSSRRSEAGSERTVRPARKDRDGGSRYSESKHTAIPYRGKEREREGKRSILGFA